MAPMPVATTPLNALSSVHRRAMATTEAMAQEAGWSSLPADLVNRVADGILATNDLDYYMDLRAVCHGWRSSTADPKTTSHDVRFHPTRWIVLDELSQGDDARLFVHADTGRFLRRNLPLLRDYHHVTSTTGGFLVLADMEPPHAAVVLNPFTGCLTRFKAPVPYEVHMAADVVGASPVLVVVDSRSDEFRFFHADPDSDHFHVEPVPGSVVLAPSKASEVVFLGPILSSFLVLRRRAVNLGPPGGGEMLLVDRSPLQGVHLYRSHGLESDKGKLERVYSIGGRALFVGTRCISIIANSFPTIKSNCIYYMKEEDGSSHIYLYDLALDKQERIAEATIYPASILQLLVEYTMCSPSYKPALDKFNQEISKMLENFDSFFPNEETLTAILQTADDPEDLEDDGYYPFVD